MINIYSNFPFIVFKLSNANQRTEMRILLIASDPRKESLGGVESHVNNLSKFLSKTENVELSLLQFGNKCDMCDKNNINLYLLQRITEKMYLYFFILPLDLLRLIRIIIKINPDIVHIQSTHPLYCLLGICIHKFYPTIITVHGFISEEYKYDHGSQKFVNKFFFAPLERFALSSVPYIIVVCPQLRKMIIDISKSKVFVIPNGIDLDLIKIIGDNKILGNNAIFYIGNLIERKDVGTLIRAMPMVKKEINDLKLFIAGKGKEEINLRKLVSELHLEKDICFLGFISDNEKYSYLKSANIFVLPSYWESFPIVLLEAMACGKPIVATNVAGNPFAVKNEFNGYLFTPGNSEELARDLIKLLKNKELSNRFSTASSIRAADFDWRKIIDKTIKIYMHINKNIKK
jgi:glycosyltransferase involved in cell wall biosynthesis